jgi:hypothetical protein
VSASKPWHALVIFTPARRTAKWGGLWVENKKQAISSTSANKHEIVQIDTRKNPKEQGQKSENAPFASKKE